MSQPHSDYDEQNTSLSYEERQKRIDETLSGIDQKLIAYAGVKTPFEMAEITGIKPEEVAQRILALLNSLDFFTIQQKRALMVYQLSALVSEIYVRRESISDRNIGSALNSAGGNIQRVLVTLKEMEERDARDLAAQEEAYSRRLLLIVQRAFDRQLGALGERYPDIDSSDLAKEFQQSIMTVAREMDLEESVQ